MTSMMSIYARCHTNPKQYRIVKTSQLRKINKIPAIIISGRSGEEADNLLTKARRSGLKNTRKRIEITGTEKIAILLAYQITLVPLHCIGI